MAKTIKSADKWVGDAKVYGKLMHRSAPNQLEYWVQLGKLAEETPDLTFNFCKK